ncbi:G-protein coupled receptor GRL101-like [Bolinopsis microptera]|uniref:G-protein coupled receptor GRL101-like n=1 Tax=Bolinopsis microptera TaxID=2820187 RepID=UPI00307A046E
MKHDPLFCSVGDDECNSDCDYSRFWNNSGQSIERVDIGEYFNSTPGFCKNFDNVTCNKNGKHFKCDNGKCVPQIGVCNTLDNCGDWSDEKGCPGRFYCQKKKPLYVPWENVCDGASDCLDGSDECQDCNFDILANDQSLIANSILSALVWVMGTIALLGNLILILTKGNELKNSGAKMNSVTKISTLLLVNLAMSDFLMGVYLIGIAAMERKLNGHYCEESKRWRSSFSCKLFGSICLLSSECSIFMMTLITLHRLISVIFPRKISTLGRRGLVAWYISIVSVWILVLCLAWVPNMHALQEYFVSEAYYQNNSFFGKGDKKTLQRYAWLYNKTVPSGTIPPDNLTMSWDQIFHIIEQSGLGSTYKYYGLMGFYSSHGVCLHKLFTTTASSSWIYSLSLNIFNSFCFIFIVVSYSYILTVSKKLSSKSSGRMARKVQRLVLTDALCWIPTCICAYLYIAGVNLSDELYAYTAILILPINSCLNPIVYTDIIDQVHVWILKHVVRVGSDSFNSSPSVATMGDKVHNPVDQLTAIQEQSVVHSRTGTAGHNDTNHLQTTTLGPSEPTINTRSSLAKLSPRSYHPQDG